jgi:class 3 adenylate cyclase/predicted ATPase
MAGAQERTAMTDIAGWLSGLGLAEYIPLFAENDIDLAILADLGDGDLKELGISLGHRRKLLRAAQSLARQAVEPDEAGRRQLSVMFCDLVGSTALSTQLDPEDLREVILAYQRAASQAVRTYGGFIAKFMGDGILVYFGYPKAREDDAERAVRTGLDILAAVGRLTTPAGIVPQVRVGIATGPVVVGDLIGEGVAQERQVVGEAPNLAARLQGLAAPGSMVIAGSTRRLLGNLFTLEDLGRHELKGFADPIQAWAVAGAAPVASRFEAMRSAGLAGFIGRAEPATELIRLKDLAWGGQGQVVVLSGEAGIGKSRLAAWLAASVAPDAPVRLSYQCSAYHSNSALHPTIQQLRLAAELDPADPSERQLDKLEALLALSPEELPRVAPLFASLLSIPTGTRYPPLDVDAAQQRRLLLAALVERLERLAAYSKLLILFEDLHWADTTSRELIERATERLAKLPALVIVTTRPGEALPWAKRANVAVIALDRVSAQEAGEMVRWLTGGRAVPPELIQQILAKTDGVPLFIEELTRSVLESGQLVLDEAAGGYRLAGSLTELLIPATLQDLLMARLDRLEGVGPVAQVCAAIGRVFTQEMVAAVSGLSASIVAAAFVKLVEADLVRPSGHNGHARYAFKHALIQDAAYESLLKSKRQALHATIVDVIERQFPELVELEEDVLAQHCSRAQLALKAIDYWLKAARRSASRSHLAETAIRIEAALKLLPAQPESIERDKLELTCQSMLARALVSAKGYALPEGMAAWHRAQALALAVGTIEQRFVITYGLWLGQYAQGDLPGTKASAERCLAEATRLGDRTQLCVAERMTGIALYAAGDFVPAIRHFDHSAGHYDRRLHVGLANELGFDLLAAALSFKAMALWPLGYPDQARRAIAEVMTHAEALGHAPSLAYSYAHAGILAEITLRDEDTLARRAEAVVALAQKHGFVLWDCVGRMALGWVNSRRGGGQAAVDQILQAQAILRRTGTRAYDGMVTALLSEAEDAAGAAPKALATLASGIAQAEASGLAFWLAELYRLQGTITYRSGGNADMAETSLRRAIDVARRQQALSWELRAGIDLATLLAERGQGSEGHAQLAEIYGRFDEGFDTTDLKSARTLIERLAG